MEKREVLQCQWKDLFIEQVKLGRKKHILHLTQRSGKTPTSLRILKELNLLESRVLISYPDSKILTAWIEAQDKFDIHLKNVTYTNTASLSKYSHLSWDVYVMDELTDYSENESTHLKKIIRNSEYVLGLSGTISKDSEKRLREDFNLDILVRYTQSQAIKDGLISDYLIEIIQVPLSSDKVFPSKKGLISEKKKFDNLSYVITKLKGENKNAMFPTLNRNRILQGSLSKQRKIKYLLDKYKEERILVFTGLTKVADNLGIDSFHSKSKDKTIFDKFLRKEINHMAVAKIGEAGVTYPDLDRVILSSFTYDSETTSQILSRCMVLDYKDKVAKITIVVSNEPVEIKKLNQTLVDLDKSKIIWL